MAEKKTTKKAAQAVEAEVKAPAAKKPARKAAVKATVAINAENVGFKAGDVYQALAAADKALDYKAIAKAANISEEETLLGIGWLLKEGKLLSNDNLVTLA